MSKPTFIQQIARTRTGASVKQTRYDMGLTMGDLEEKGFDRSYISKLEHGKIPVGIDVLAKLADAMGCEAHVVFRVKPPSNY